MGRFERTYPPVTTSATRANKTSHRLSRAQSTMRVNMFLLASDHPHSTVSLILNHAFEHLRFEHEATFHHHSIATFQTLHNFDSPVRVLPGLDSAGAKLVLRILYKHNRDAINFLNSFFGND